MSINEKTTGSLGYVAFYFGKRIELYANSSFQAVELAREHFKPPKSKRHMVHVILAEDSAGEIVEHFPLD